ncbi:MAG: polysaccharide deacetylase family protein [Actinomycetota bacterium]|nr:polysaccharide deacetylase family protein [Actinomycetota bacterium]
MIFDNKRLQKKSGRNRLARILIILAILLLTVTINSNHKTSNMQMSSIKNLTNLFPKKTAPRTSGQEHKKNRAKSFIYLPSTHRSEQIPARKLEVPKAIPILMYHRINNTATFGNCVERNLTISVQTFTNQLNWFLSNGYHVVSLNEAFDALYLHKPLPIKPIVLTFDDGTADAYYNVYPILKKRGLTGTFFVKVKCVDSGDGLNWGKAVEMTNGGMQIESHTMTHIDLSLASSDELLYELQKSKNLLEKHLRQTVRFLAYPSGSFNDQVIAAAKRCGYSAALTTEPGLCRPGDNPFKLKRIRISRGQDLGSLSSLLNCN